MNKDKHLHVNFEIIEMAYSARRLFKTGSVYDQKLMDLYCQYSPIQDLCVFFSRAKHLFPRLNCGISSVYLKHRLGIGEIIRGAYQGQGHTFLLLDGKTVVDITADQFGGPPVYVGPLCFPWDLLRKE